MQKDLGITNIFSYNFNYYYNKLNLILQEVNKFNINEESNLIDSDKNARKCQLLNSYKNIRLNLK